MICIKWAIIILISVKLKKKLLPTRLLILDKRVKAGFAGDARGL